MRIFLGVLLVVVVSGNTEVTINANLEGSAVLPCTCTEKQHFKWQMEEPNMVPVFYDKIMPRYRDRAEVHNNGSNCSLSLSNITADDQGKYRCSFKVGDQYIYSFVNLNISATYNVCHETPSASGNEEMFHCHANGRYQEAEIQWYLDGELLTNSSKINIIHSKTVAASNGIYFFKSQLQNTNVNRTSELQCQVKAKGISIINSYTCEQLIDPERIADVPQPYVMRYLKIIPIVLVLGISFVLWQRFKILE